MNAGHSEFCRLVSLARVGTDPYRQEIVATEDERAALARRFDLVSLDRLSATIELVRQGGGTVLLRAAFDAEFAQSCVVTLDPVPGALSERFTLVYGPPEAEEGSAAAEDDIAFEPLSADVIDVGEAVAQEFSLLLPPFPRNPETSIEAEEPPRSEAGPFAPLLRLASRERSQ